MSSGIIFPVSSLRPNATYKEYLQTDHWLKLRKECYEIANFKCQRCFKKNKPLEAHHLHYGDQPGLAGWLTITVKDLRALCCKCHKKVHKGAPLVKPVKQKPKLSKSDEFKARMKLARKAKRKLRAHMKLTVSKKHKPWDDWRFN